MIFFNENACILKNLLYICAVTYLRRVVFVHSICAICHFKLNIQNSCFIDNCVFKESGQSGDYPFFVSFPTFPFFPKDSSIPSVPIYHQQIRVKM